MNLDTIGHVVAASRITARLQPSQTHRSRISWSEDSTRFRLVTVRCTYDDGRIDRHASPLLASSLSSRHETTADTARLLSSEARSSDAEVGHTNPESANGKHSREDDRNWRKQTATGKKPIRDNFLDISPSHFALTDSVDGNLSDGIDFPVGGHSTAMTTESEQRDGVPQRYPPAPPGGRPMERYNAALATDRDTGTETGSETDNTMSTSTGNRWSEGIADSPPYLLWWSSLVGKMVVSEKEAKLLGVAWQPLTTPSASHLVAFKLQAAPLSSLPLLSFLSVGQSFHLPTTSVLRSSDVILVDSVLSLSPPPLPGPSTPVPLIGGDAVTESGGYVGKVRDIAFDPGSGRIAWFLVDPLGLPFLPLQLLTTYLLPADVAIAAAGSCLYVRDASEGAMRQHRVGPLDALFRSDHIMAGEREGRGGRFVGNAPQGTSEYEQQEGASRGVTRAAQAQVFAQGMRGGDEGEQTEDGGREGGIRPPARHSGQLHEASRPSLSYREMDNWSDDDPLSRR